MKKLYTNNRDQFITYNKQTVAKNKAPYVIFIHGFMSDMNGSKAISTENYCARKGYNFIRFDNFGCGLSSGIFTDQTVTNWLAGLSLVIDKLATAQVLLIGSSLGGWLALLATKLHSEKIIGVITLASAVDFTEDLIWNKLSTEEKKLLQEEKIFNIRGNNPGCTDSYPINYKLIEDGRKHLMLTPDCPNIDVSCPLHLIHGMQDIDVPYSISLKIMEKCNSSKIIVKLIKDGDHRLSRAQDLEILHHSIEEVIHCREVLPV